MCPCSKKHSRSLCTAAIGDRRKWVIPSAELPVLTNPGDRESDVVHSSTQNTVLSSTASQYRKNVLISTGSVFLRNNEGRELKCPVIFDSASNINIISRKMCDFLGITIEKINSSVSGLSSLKQNLKGKTNSSISKKSGIFRENVEFFVTEKITGLTPSVTLDVSERKIPEFLELSDPYFYEAKEIHALLNADIFFRIIKDNVYKVNKELLFRETEFGQELWIKKITWDEILPPKLKEKWLIWCKELPLLDNLRIPRLVLDSTNDEVSDLIAIHIICDASKLAYGAAAYVKVRKQNEVLVNLITSKTRMAPLKAVTLPRLELLGALVAARLSSRVQEIVRKKKECKVFHWTDSKK
ncbi:integrase catalytic domain-containing protein [Trichonephila clavipes]|nr:integrase catalytic domain-containing protein [Trichonephila clavipes]